MMLPGFTAEAGLAHHVDRYGGAAEASSVQPNGSITPAGMVGIGWGDACDHSCALASVLGGCWCIVTA